jgi:DNA-binding winged helix-turn-helix (wHTH) protein
MVANDSSRPLNFREEDIRYVMQSLLAGKSCALIGVDGTGKSSLIRHLISKPVREHYLGDRDHFQFFLIDSHELPTPSALAYYRRMVSLLDTAASKNGHMRSLREIPASHDEESVLQRLFEQADVVLGEGEQHKLVFCIDEFDVVFTEVEPQFLRILQALRNRVGGRICYIVLSNNLPSLVNETRGRTIIRDMFSELFERRVRGIKPLLEKDSLGVIERELGSHYKDCPPRIRELFRQVSGSHHGILKIIIAAYKDGNVALREDDTVLLATEKLLSDVEVLSKCEQLWNHLSDIEQHLLKHMQDGELSKSITIQQHSMRQISEAIDSLVLKGILIESRHNNGSYRCFSPLFLTYLLRHIFSVSRGLRLDPMRQRLWIDGAMQAVHLTANEFRLLSFLATHAGEICPREETTRAVYGEEYNAVSDDGRLDALVERARKKIGDSTKSPRFLETVRGIGHRLNEYLGEQQ